MNIRKGSLLTLALLVALPLAAQEPAKDAKPPEMTAQHKAIMKGWEKAGMTREHSSQLEALAGDWTAKQSMWMGSKTRPMTETGTSTNALTMGGRHLRSEYRSQRRMGMDEPFEGVSHIGYDYNTGKYYNSWMDNNSTGLFVAHGDYDAATKTYTFTGEMYESPQGRAKVPMRELLRIVDNDHHVFEMYETRDGKEAKTMQIEYTRAK